MVETYETSSSSHHSQNEGSFIVSRFKGKKLFITGATGYLGKTLLEKLLRVCTSIDKIYLLVRDKKGVNLNKRFEDIFSGPIWSELEEINPKYREKVYLMAGDMYLPKLGLSDENVQIIKNEVNIYFHLAATVRFDQHIKIAAYTNVRGVRDLIAIAKETKNLDVFVHVSTAYSNCPQPIIDEKFYDPPMSEEDLLKLVNLLSDEKLTEITPTFVHPWPNTYTFTKTISESIIKEASKTLPVVLCRPAIVSASVAEPLPGWIGNIYGPSGLIAATASGFARVLYNNTDAMAELVPSDYVVNNIIAAGAQHFKDRSGPLKSSNVHDDDGSSISPIIYNYCCSHQAPFTWGDFTNIGSEMMAKVPLNRSVWTTVFFATSNEFWYRIFIFLFHTIPAHFIDLVLKLRGRKPIAVEGYEKFDQMMKTYSFFSLTKWEIRNENVQKLWKMLSKEDKKLFPFSMEKFDWRNYCRIYAMGIRLYLFNDYVETIPQAIIRHKVLKVMHYALVTVIMVVLYLIFSYTFSFFKYLCLMF